MNKLLAKPYLHLSRDSNPYVRATDQVSIANLISIYMKNFSVEIFSYGKKKDITRIEELTKVMY